MNVGVEEYKRVREEIKDAYEFQMDHEVETEPFTEVEKGFRAMILGLDEMGMNARQVIGIGNPYYTPQSEEERRHLQFNANDNRVSFGAGALHGQQGDFLEGAHTAARAGGSDPNSAKGIPKRMDPILVKEDRTHELYLKEVLFNPLMRNDDEEEFMQVIHHTPSDGRRLSRELRMRRQWHEAERVRVEEVKQAKNKLKDPFEGLQRRAENKDRPTTVAGGWELRG